MNRLTTATAVLASAALLATGAFAGEKAKTTIRPLTVAKSTQAPPPALGLGGLGAGASAGLIALGVVAVAAAVAASSAATSTSGT